MKLFSRIKFVFCYGPEIDALLHHQREKHKEMVREASREFVDLCEAHQPRSGSLYSRDDCDVCSLQAALKVVRPTAKEQP